MNRFKSTVFIIFILFFIFNFGLPVFSAVCTPLADGTTPANCGSGSVSLPNPLDPTGKNSVTPQTLIGKVIAAALGVVGSLALLMFIYGGFTWMTSAGSPDKVTKGKGIMVWAAIGLAVIFSSYALVKFVITGLTT
ncbi:MAG: pilin [Candidatus Gracilibacteria bacterium]